jgi:hypothetical protein
MAEATRNVRLYKYSVLLGILATSVGLGLAGCSDTEGDGDASTDGGKDSTVDTGPAPAATDFLLNEVKTGLFKSGDPTFAGNSQFLELLGPSDKALPANAYVLVVNNVATVSGSTGGPRQPNPDAGKVVYAFAIPAGTKTGSNGLVLIQASANPYTAASGTTVVNDGTLDSPAFPQAPASYILATASAPLASPVGKAYSDVAATAGFQVLDAVGFGFLSGDTPDKVYPTESAGIPGIWSGSSTPAGIVRFLGNESAQDGTAWWGGRLVKSDAASPIYENAISTTDKPLTSSAAQPPSPTLTPGAPNPAGGGGKPDAGADGGKADGGKTDGGKDGGDAGDAGDAADGDADAAD